MVNALEEFETQVHTVHHRELSFTTSPSPTVPNINIEPLTYCNSTNISIFISTPPPYVSPALYLTQHENAIMSELRQDLCLYYLSTFTSTMDVTLEYFQDHQRMRCTLRLAPVRDYSIEAFNSGFNINHFRDLVYRLNVQYYKLSTHYFYQGWSFRNVVGITIKLSNCRSRLDFVISEE